MSQTQNENETQNPHLGPEPHVSDFNRPIVEEFRANAGRVGGPFEGGDLLLLTTVGARSGRAHTTPLGYVRDGERLLVVGSAGGSPRHPDWYDNLLAHPMVQVEVGTEAYGAVAIPAEGAERDRLFAHIVRTAPGYGDYQARVERTLPVVALERSYVEGGPAQVANLADKLIEIHTWLRDQIRHVRTLTDAHFAARAGNGDPGQAPALSLDLQIRQHCLAFCDSIHFHHSSEDAGMLPGLEHGYPELADVIARLRAEHATVARIHDALVEMLADVGTADPDRFREELDRMAVELEGHLDFEEESLIPIQAAIPFPPGPPGGDTENPADERA